MHERIEDTLHTIQTETWLSKTDEQNRQKATNRRNYMVKLIRKKLATMNQSEVDSALSLNVRDNNNFAHQMLRKGVRAIMLAQFTLRDVPLSFAKVLKQRWLNQDGETIRKGFLASFPLIPDAKDPDRACWDQQYFTDPKSFPDWVNWKDNCQYCFILHCLPPDDSACNTLANPNVTIASWDAISTSVVDETNSVIYGYYGFVLTVPKENIVAADSKDQNLLNHLGTIQTRSPNHERYLNKQTKDGLLTQHLADLFAYQERLKTPLECIRQDRDGRWNEVIVMGRSLSGRPTTVSALFYRVSSNHRYYVPGVGKSQITDKIEGWVTDASIAHKIPIIYIPDSTGKLG
jgi:hypothetical protein